MAVGLAAITDAMRDSPISKRETVEVDWDRVNANMRGRRSWMYDEHGDILEEA